MLGRFYFSIGICTKYYYDSKRNGFNKSKKVSFLFKKLSIIARNPKCSAILSGVSYFFNCDDKKLSFEAKNAIRPFIVAGNMKMNGNRKDIEELLERLGRIDLDPEIEIVVAPPSPYLDFSKCKAPRNISLAAQNCFKVAKGSFTGEISPAMLQDIGVGWVILGHSERRRLFCENDSLIKEKICHSHSQGMSIIACVGETLEERENGMSEEAILCQLQCLGVSVVDWTKVVIAYEPLWTNGKAKLITPKEAQKVHSKIRDWLRQNVSATAAKITRIIYAGPVLDSNYTEFAKMPDVDGFLFEDTFFNPDDFMHIIYDSTEF